MIPILLCKNWTNSILKYVKSNGLQKYRSFNINNKLASIDNFQFSSSLLESLYKNFLKGGFKYLSEEFDINILDKGKQKVFYPYDYMTAFEKI